MTPARHRPSAVAVAGCLLTTLLAARGAAAADTVTDEARRLFDEALAHVDAGEFAEAATAFRAAYLIAPNWRVLYNIAEAESGAGNHARALEAYTLYLAEGGEDIHPDQERRTRKAVSRLSRLVGMLLVKCPTAGAVVLIGGRRQGVTPLLGPALLDAGEHEVVVVKEGREIHRQLVRVEGGQLVWAVVDDSGGRDYAAAELTPPADLEPDPGPEPALDPYAESGAEPAPPAAPLPPPGPAPRASSGPEGKAGSGPLAWVMLGTGAAAAVAAAGLGSTALSGARAVDRACDGDRCPAAELERAERVRNLAVATDVLIGVSAAALVTGGVLLLVGRGKGERREAVTWAPAANRGGGVMVIEGRF